MKKRMMKIMCCLVFGGVFLLLLPSIGLSQDACTAVIMGGNSYSTIQEAINTASYGIISVTGTCNENINIPSGKFITLDGGGTAIINGVDANQPTVYTWGGSIKGFTITGGLFGIMVGRYALVMIQNNTIESTGGGGIFLVEDANARIFNNTIRYNPGDGILVDVNSTVRIGFNSMGDTVASPNTIEHNDGNGITLRRCSSALIVGNTISENAGDGIKVARVAQADISSNTINGNKGNGILVTQNSGVNLGNDTGDTIFDFPNTTTLKNGLFGVQGTIGGYADGRLGTLNGLMGRAWFDFRSINSLKPYYSW